MNSHVLCFQFNSEKEPTIKNFLFLEQGSSSGSWGRTASASRKVRWDWWNISVNWNLSLLFRQSFFTAIYDPYKILNDWMENEKPVICILPRVLKCIHKQANANKRTLDFDEQYNFFTTFESIYRWLPPLTGGSLLSPSDVSRLRSPVFILSYKMKRVRLIYTTDWPLTSVSRKELIPALNVRFSGHILVNSLLYVLTCYVMK